MKHFYTRRGENKSSKKAPLFLLPFCVRRARDFLLLFRGKAALVFFSLSCLSLHPRSSRVFFKKSGRKSICWLFFSLEKSRAFSTTKPLSKRPVIYISLYSFTHNKYYNDAYHSSLAEARKRKRECLLLLLLYLSRSCCCCLNAKERARSFLLKAKFIIVFLSCG